MKKNLFSQIDLNHILMDIRLGYACHNMSLPEVTAAHRVTAKTLLNYNREEQLGKLREVLRNNLNSLQTILHFNVSHGIKLYRIPSELVPLATHEITDSWNYFGEFFNEFQKIGEFIKSHDLRTTAHVTQFTFLNSIDEKVYKQAIQDILYHTGLLDTMGLDDSNVVVMHIGGLYNDKENALKRFISNFNKLPDKAKKRLVVENDDKCFSIKDVLQVTGELKIPAVLDYHHFQCLNSGESLNEIMNDVKDSWGKRKIKVHFSSPKSDSQFRSHSDYIDVDSFYHFLTQLHILKVSNIDIMLECKAKDMALLKLRDELKIFQQKYSCLS